MGSWKQAIVALWCASAPIAVFAEPPDRGLDGDKDEDLQVMQLPAAPRTDNVQVPAELEAALQQMIAAEAKAQKEGGDKVADATKALEQQLTAAASKLEADGQLRAAQGALHQGLHAEAIEDSSERELAALQARADEAREQIWKQWQRMVGTRNVSEADAHREFEKHALREAKLLRIETLAQESGDSEALERVHKLLELETQRNGKRMQQLITDGEKGSSK